MFELFVIGSIGFYILVGLASFALFFLVEARCAKDMRRDNEQ